MSEKKSHLNTINNKIKKKYEDIIKFNENEINSLDYSIALEMDKRNFVAVNWVPH